MCKSRGSSFSSIVEPHPWRKWMKHVSNCLLMELDKWRIFHRWRARRFKPVTSGNSHKFLIQRFLHLVSGDGWKVTKMGGIHSGQWCLRHQRDVESWLGANAKNVALETANVSPQIYCAQNYASAQDNASRIRRIEEEQANEKPKYPCISNFTDVSASQAMTVTSNHSSWWPFWTFKMAADPLVKLLESGNFWTQHTKITQYVKFRTFCRKWTYISHICPTTWKIHKKPTFSTLDSSSDVWSVVMKFNGCSQIRTIGFWGLHVELILIRLSIEHFKVTSHAEYVITCCNW